MSNGIYGYYDTKNQYVVYIGQDAHIDKEKRHKEHLSPSHYDRQHINRVLQNNSDRYVYFKFVEGNYSQHEIDDFEKEAIKLFKTYKYDYPERSVFNFTTGGDFNPMKVPEIVKKISKAMSGKNNPMYGKDFSKEHRDKMSKAKIGKKPPMYGRTHTEESKEKMSKSHIGKTLSEKTKIKMSKNKNIINYFRVCKRYDKRYKQGFIYVYKYYDEEKKRKEITSVDLNKLEKKVVNKGLEWRKFEK